MHFRISSWSSAEQKIYTEILIFICCGCSVAKLCPSLRDPMDCRHQASLSFTIPWSLLKLKSIDSVMPSNHLILCGPFSSCPQSFSASRSFPMSRLFASGGQQIGHPTQCNVGSNFIWPVKSMPPSPSDFWLLSSHRCQFCCLCPFAFTLVILGAGPQVTRNRKGTFMAVQWLGLHLPMQGVRAQSLVGDLESHVPHGQKTEA